MKILTFIDTHGSGQDMRLLKEKAKDVDLILCGGDITIFEHHLNMILKDMDSFNKKIYIIHGNHESASTMKESCAILKNVEFLDKQGFIIDDYAFFCGGGGGFSKFDEPFHKKFVSFIEDVKKRELKEKRHFKLIVMSHAPPFETNLDDLGYHVGCKSYTTIINEYQPALYICGHIHETAGIVEHIGKTIAINPGPEGMIVDLKTMDIE